MDEALILLDSKNAQIYQLLKDILYTGFNIEAHLVNSADDLNEKFDHGIREMMWPGYRERPTSKKYSQMLNVPFTITLLRSQLGFYNIIITLPYTSSYNTVSVGPFRAEDTTAKYYEKILHDAHVPYELLSSASAMFKALPKANPDTIASICKRICVEIYDEFSDVEILNVNFIDEKHSETIDANQLEAHEIANAKKIQETIREYMHAIEKGDTKTARDILNANASEYINPQEQGITWQKANIQSINQMAAIAALNTSVHPYRVIQLQRQLDMTIYDCSGAIELSLIPYDITHKYCLLVKNYANSDVSSSIREILDYISYNLDEDLSLDAIAQRFNKNKSSLSTSFHKQTGYKLNEYVTRARIMEAIRLFNTTSAPISDVAIAVGFSDFAYFSKQFKKITGLSPSQYQGYQGDR